jgi:transcriptional regulator with XRE-family HTH domain
MRCCPMPKLTSMINAVPEEELRELMASLRNWAWKQHGRSKEIAAALNVTEETVSRWLNGRKIPSLKSYWALQAFWKKVSQSGQK